MRDEGAVLAVVLTSVSLETVLYVSDTGGRSGSLQHTADVVREIQLIIRSYADLPKWWICGNAA